MKQDETALGAALRRAGVDVNVRLMAAATEAMQQAGGDRAKAARVLWERCCADTELRFSAMNMPLELAARDMQGPGHAVRSEKTEPGFPASLHDKTPGEGKTIDAEKAKAAFPSPRRQSRAVGARFPLPKGKNAGSPAREPSESRRNAFAAAHKSAAKAVGKTFEWLDGLYDRKTGKPIIAMTYGELKAVVNRQRRDVQYHVKNACTSAHTAIVARKLLDECDAQGVLPDNALWAKILPQDKIKHFEQVWTKEKITREFIRYLADSDERTLEVFLSKPEPTQINA